MAIARLSMKVGKAGKAGPHAAYIARVGPYAGRLERGERLEATHAGNMPAWAQSNPQAFWEAADANERINGTTYREMEIALPRELSPEHRVELVRVWVDQELGDRHAYQWAIHVPTAADGGEQPHVHLMFSERRCDGIERDPEQYFRRYNAKAPERSGAQKGYGDTHDALKGPARQQARAADLKVLRGRWADACNQAMARAGVGERIDMRSNAERGIGDLAEAKQLPSAWRDPAQRSNVIEFRAAKAEHRAAVADVVRQMPEPAKLIALEHQRTERTDVARLDVLSTYELRVEVRRRAPPTFEQMAEQHPQLAPFVGAWMRAQRGAEWCARRLQAIGQRVAKHLDARDQWEKVGGLGGLWRGVQSIAQRAGAAFGTLKTSDAWLASQARQRTRTERVLTLRQAQMETLSGETRKLASQLRPEIEHRRGELAKRHQRAVEVLAVRERVEAQHRAEQREQERARRGRTGPKR